MAADRLTGARDSGWGHAGRLVHDRVRSAALRHLPLAGAIHGIGAAGPPTSPFVLGQGLARERLVGTKAVNLLVMQLAKPGTDAAFGALHADILAAGTCVDVCGIAGVVLARHHLRAIDDDRGHGYLLTAIGIAAAIMLHQGLSG